MPLDELLPVELLPVELSSVELPVELLPVELLPVELSSVELLPVEPSSVELLPVELLPDEPVPLDSVPLDAIAAFRTSVWWNSASDATPVVPRLARPTMVVTATARRLPLVRMLTVGPSELSFFLRAFSSTYVFFYSSTFGHDSSTILRLAA